MTAIVLAAAAVLIIGVSNAATWAITRIRTHRADYSAAEDAGYVAGRTIGYHEGFGHGEMSYAQTQREVAR